MEQCRKTAGEEYVVDQSSVQFLLSLAGGENQELHTDYTALQAYAMQKIGGLVPLFVVCPLWDTAKLRIGNILGEVREGVAGEAPNGFHFRQDEQPVVEEVEIKWNDLLVMHGYAPHGGSKYKKQNVRLHFYLMPRKCLEALGEGVVVKSIGLLSESIFSKHQLLY